MIIISGIPSFVKWWNTLKNMSFANIFWLFSVWSIFAGTLFINFRGNDGWDLLQLFNYRVALTLVVLTFVAMLLRQRESIVIVSRAVLFPGMNKDKAEIALNTVREARDAALSLGGLIALISLFIGLRKIDDVAAWPRYMSLVATGVFQGVFLSEIVLLPVQKLLSRRSGKGTAAAFPVWRGLLIACIALVLGMSGYGIVSVGIDNAIRPPYTPLRPTAVDKETLKFSYFAQLAEMQHKGAEPAAPEMWSGDIRDSERKLEGHKVVQGKGMVLLYRVFDSERFVICGGRMEAKKLTIEIPDYNGSATYTLPSDNIKAYFTSTKYAKTVAFPSTAIRGRIKIRNAGYGSIMASIDLKMGKSSIQEKQLEFVLFRALTLYPDAWMNGTDFRPQMVMN